MNTYYTTKEYGEMLGITVAAVNKQIKTGKIKASRNKRGSYEIYAKDLPKATLKKIEKIAEGRKQSKLLKQMPQIRMS